MEKPKLTPKKNHFPSKKIHILCVYTQMSELVNLATVGGCANWCPTDRFS